MHKPCSTPSGNSSGRAQDTMLSAMVGSSPVMRELKRELAQVANSNSTVLITGETGTGKELAAEFIHQQSRRRDKPFVCINCAAIPESLLESELFGHAKGAFTGASEVRDGLLSSARGGTILLDEIGDMSLCAQAKILRVIEKGEVTRVGSNRGVQLDLRFVAATNQDLEKMADCGTFRKDLFFRLNVARIQMPPLRERPEDIPILLQYYCRSFSGGMEFGAPRFSDEALQRLVAYGWPGNVRELKNLVESMFLRDMPSTIEAKHLPQRLHAAIAGRAELPRAEREMLIAALFTAKWNKSEAARSLRWSRMTLYRKIAKHRLAQTP